MDCSAILMNLNLATPLISSKKSVHVQPAELLPVEEVHGVLECIEEERLEVGERRSEVLGAIVDQVAYARDGQALFKQELLLRGPSVLIQLCIIVWVHVLEIHKLLQEYGQIHVARIAQSFLDA